MMLSIIIPAYNEEESIGEIVSRLEALRQSLSGKTELEIIYVDDHSTDRTPVLLAQVCQQNKNFRFIRL